MKKWLLILCLIVCFTGCKIFKEHTNTIIKTDTLIIYHDSLYFIPADSAFIKAFFECDSLNEVVMTELSIEKGRKVIPVVQFRDKLLTVDIPVDSETVALRWMEIHTKSNSVTDKATIEYIKIWPKWLVIMAAIGALSIVLVLFRIFKPR